MPCRLRGRGRAGGAVLEVDSTAFLPLRVLITVRLAVLIAFANDQAISLKAHYPGKRPSPLVDRETRGLEKASE